jgi:Domain of unknown function (DUF4129)
MSRAWDEFVAAAFDVVPGPVMLLLLLVAAGVLGTLWYTFPAWVPRRLPRLHLPRFRWKRRTKKPVPEPVLTAAEPEPEPEPEVPLPAGALSLADRLAAEGRYAEAIRQRLRDTIRDLVAAGIVAPQPGWTAAELAAVASARRPAVAWPLGSATELFSEIWYGDRPAQQLQDDRMRELTGQVLKAAR